MDVTPERFAAAIKPCDNVIAFGLRFAYTGIDVPNDFVADFINKMGDPKIVPWMSVDPNDLAYMDEFEHARSDLGMCGVKLGPIYQNVDPRDKKLHPLYSECTKHNLPILFHTGTTFCQDAPLRYSRPHLWDEVATDFPDLVMILAHMSHPWETECIATIRKHPNLYANVSALYYRPWQLYNTMILAQEYGVNRKLLFGSDFPFTTAVESIDGLRSLNRMVEGTNLPRVSSDMLDEIIYRDSLDAIYNGSVPGR
jgi:hypothetical protein